MSGPFPSPMQSNGYTNSLDKVKYCQPTIEYNLHYYNRKSVNQILSISIQYLNPFNKIYVNPFSYLEIKHLHAHTHTKQKEMENK